MSFLLDTHALIWWLAAPMRLSRLALACIEGEDAQVFVSVASLYEIEYKRDRDQFLYRLPKDLLRLVPMLGFEWLSLEPDDALDAARLASGHRDPWDRIIAVQAERRRLGLITADVALSRACVDWRVKTVW